MHCDSCRRSVNKFAPQNIAKLLVATKHDDALVEADHTHHSRGGPRRGGHNGGGGTSPAEGRKFAQQHGLLFAATSALEGGGVDESFALLAEAMLESREAAEASERQARELMSHDGRRSSHAPHVVFTPDAHPHSSPAQHRRPRHLPPPRPPAEESFFARCCRCCLPAPTATAHKLGSPFSGGSPSSASRASAAAASAARARARTRPPQSLPHAPPGGSRPRRSPETTAPPAGAPLTGADVASAEATSCQLASYSTPPHSCHLGTSSSAAAAAASTQPAGLPEPPQTYTL